MKNLLQPHTPIDNINIDTSFELTKHQVFLTFTVSGVLENYIFSEKIKEKRAHELWKETCFELFLANSKEKGYYELNISPSMEWNFYYLHKYRAKVKEVEDISLTIDSYIKDNNYIINVNMESKYLNFEDLNLYNIAAILLNKKEKRTFWALNSTNLTPDFHNKKFFSYY